MTEENPGIGIIGVTPRTGKAISDEMDSCEIVLKTSGIPPLRREDLVGYGKSVVGQFEADSSLRFQFSQ
jgi:hypothetical protein